MSTTTTVPKVTGLAKAQAGIVAASFSMLLAGSNATYPLLPVYRDTLGLDPLVISLTFTLYVGFLVPVLFLLARPRFTRHAPLLLLFSLGTMIPSDLFMAHAQEHLILIGRALGGIAGGLGTGAASALVVAAIGARGRAVTATGNTIGGIAGVSGAQITVLVLTANAPQAVFIGHAALTSALSLAAAVVLWRRRNHNKVALQTLSGTGAASRLDRTKLRLFTSGALAWTAISIAAVFGAAMFNELNMSLVQIVGPILLVISSTAGQLCSPLLLRAAPWASGTFAMAAGITCILIGAWLSSELVAIAGFVVLGSGIGLAYRAALVALTKGTTPAQQGALASLYAAITYAIAATVVLAIGGIGNMTGLVTASSAVLGAIGLLAVISVAWAPRLLDTRNYTQQQRRAHRG